VVPVSKVGSFNRFFTRMEFHGNYLYYSTYFHIIRNLFYHCKHDSRQQKKLVAAPLRGCRFAAAGSGKWRQSRLDCKTLLQNTNCIKVREIIQLKALFPEVEYHYLLPLKQERDTRKHTRSCGRGHERIKNILHG
jgi:hypothetical protein